MSAWTVWLIVGIVLIIAEIATFSFYLLWLGIGALIAALISGFYPDNLLLHIITVCVTAVGLTYFTKPLTRRMQGQKGYRDVIDDLVGRHGEVMEAIESSAMGIVRIGTETWSATADEPIAAGEKIIVQRRGTTVVHVCKLKGE